MDARQFPEEVRKLRMAKEVADELAGRNKELGGFKSLLPRGKQLPESSIPQDVIEFELIPKEDDECLFCGSPKAMGMCSNPECQVHSVIKMCHLKNIKMTLIFIRNIQDATRESFSEGKKHHHQLQEHLAKGYAADDNDMRALSDEGWSPEKKKAWDEF